jgi:hypothetical protein
MKKDLKILLYVFLGLFFIGLIANLINPEPKKEKEKKIAQRQKEFEEAIKLCKSGDNLSLNIKGNVHGLSGHIIQSDICGQFAKIKKYSNSIECQTLTVQYYIVEDLQDSYGNVSKDQVIEVFTGLWNVSDALKFNCENYPDTFNRIKNIKFGKGMASMQAKRKLLEWCDENASTRYSVMCLTLQL